MGRAGLQAGGRTVKVSGDRLEGGDGERGDDSLGRRAALDAVIGVGDHLAEE